MKIFFYTLSVLAILITAYTGIRSGLVSFTVFAVSPYVGLLYLSWIAKDKTAILTARTVILFLVSVGLYFLLDTTYMERRLGTHFSFLFIPVWQWTMLLVSGLVVYLSNTDSKECKKKSEIFKEQ